MANEIRLIILIIGLIFVGFILWDGLRKKHHDQQTDDHSTQKDRLEASTDNIPAKDDSDPFVDTKSDFQLQDLPEFDMPSDTPDAYEQEQSTSDESESDEQTVTIQQAALPKLIIFHLLARRKRVFGGFSLLQVLMDHHFHYGDMGIFHYYEKHHQEGKKLFSLAAATPTGDFPISDMASFQCKGLILFMYPEEHTNPSQVFDKMVSIAEQLAEALQADLKIGQDKQEWNEDNLAYWYQQLF